MRKIIFLTESTADARKLGRQVDATGGVAYADGSDKAKRELFTQTAGQKRMSRIAQEIKAEKEGIRNSMIAGDSVSGERLAALQKEFDDSRADLRAIKKGAAPIPETRYQSRNGSEYVKDIGRGVDIAQARATRGNQGGKSLPYGHYEDTEHVTYGKRQ